MRSTQIYRGSVCSDPSDLHQLDSCHEKEQIDNPHEPAIPISLHLGRRRPLARRLQAVRLRQGDPAVHCAAPPRLRAGSDQTGRAG